MLRTEWTHRLICRKYIASYDEEEALADGSEEREGAGIKAEAGTDNKVKTIITADDNSTVDVTKGSLYIANAKKDGTVYDVSIAIKSRMEYKGNDFDKIYGDSRRTKAIEKDANGNYTFKSNIDEISKDSLISNILKETDENEGKLTDFVDKAFGEGTTDAQANQWYNQAGYRF